MKIDLFNYNISDSFNGLVKAFKPTGSTAIASSYRLLTGVGFGVLVTSEYHRDIIKSIDCKKALTVPGVLNIITRLNSTMINSHEPPVDKNFEKLIKAFFDKTKLDTHQPVALVVTNSPQAALEAAALIKVITQQESLVPAFITGSGKPTATNSHQLGMTTKKAANGTISLKATYESAIDMKHGGEMHATVMIPENESVRSVRNSLMTMMPEFHLKSSNIHVHHFSEKFIDGDNALVDIHEAASIVGYKKSGRPMVVLSRQAERIRIANCNFSSSHKFLIEATSEGVLNKLDNEVVVHLSESREGIAEISGAVKSLYRSNRQQSVIHSLPYRWMAGCSTPLHDKITCSFAAECAMDEMAYQLKIDPVQLRLKNLVDDRNGNGDNEYLNPLEQCIVKAADTFGWHKRNAIPASTRSGEWLVGKGAACGKLNFTGSGANAYVAHFIEVLVHPSTGEIKVTRIVTSVDVGKPADMNDIAVFLYKSLLQALNISFVGMDVQSGVSVISNFVRLPLHAYTPAIEVLFIENRNETLFEDYRQLFDDISLTGFAAAIANAIFNATGKRLRSFPIKMP